MPSTARAIVVRSRALSVACFRSPHLVRWRSGAAVLAESPSELEPSAAAAGRWLSCRTASVRRGQDRAARCRLAGLEPSISRSTVVSRPPRSDSTLPEGAAVVGCGHCVRSGIAVASTGRCVSPPPAIVGAEPLPVGSGAAAVSGARRLGSRLRCRRRPAPGSGVGSASVPVSAQCGSGAAGAGSELVSGAGSVPPSGRRCRRRSADPPSCRRPAIAPSAYAAIARGPSTRITTAP